MIQNIIFDLGGVVIDYSPKEFLMERFYSERTEKRLYDAIFGSPEWLLMDRGQLSWPEAVKIFKKRGKEKNMAFEVQAVLDEWESMLTTRGVTVTLMRLLKKRGYRLFYLSNISRETMALLSGRDFWPLFDGGVASCEVGLLKPEPGIYQAVLQRYALVPQNTIFADDNRQNAAAAYNLGITGIHFTDVKTFCRMLVTYGVEL